MTLPPNTSHNAHQTVPFIKMHGLGNDFIMVNSADLPESLNTQEGKSQLAKQWCNRHWGIGADGLIIAQPAVNPDSIATFDYWNSDGTIAQMCGNGIRCFAYYLQQQGWTDASEFNVDSLIGPMTLTIMDSPERDKTEGHPQQDPQIRVNMGAPILDAAKFPSTLPEAQATNPPVDIAVCLDTASSQTIPISLVSMGNPHALIFTDEINESLPPETFGPLIETLDIFPERTNVEFIQMNSPNHAHVTVWERGCGFTQACGTGACATAVGAILKGRGTSPMTISLPGGDLTIEWDKTTPNAPVMMTGPATQVFSGILPLQKP